MVSRICKALFFSLLMITPVSSWAQGTWKRGDIPTTQYLRSVCFVDSLYGWVVGDSGTILHTTNGGATWIQQSIQTSNEMEYVFFLNRNLGWISEFNYTTSPYGTILLKTTDGGANWQSMPYPTADIFMSCILFTDSLHGWMGGKPNGIYKTADGGATWAPAAIDTTILAFFPVLDIKFYNQKYGYASGGILDIAGVIWRTSNGGEKWYAIDPAYAPADEVHQLHVFDSLNVMGAGGDPDFGYGVGMIRSSDGGVSWVYDELDIQGNAHDLDFRNASEAWAPLGPKRKLIYSLDTGVTWTPVATPDSTYIYAMNFPDSLHGFAVGKEGAFLTYSPPVIPAVPSISSDPDKFMLYQNYPNPIVSATTIKYKLPSGESRLNNLISQPFTAVQISVSDILGNEVATLFNNDIFPGNHEVSFDASGLRGGCYFYTLRVITAGYQVTVAGPERMIILKN
jgi:photosystem II stability/assembly factor-like uncharacterized protein